MTVSVYYIEEGSYDIEIDGTVCSSPIVTTDPKGPFSIILSSGYMLYSEGGSSTDYHTSYSDNVPVLLTTFEVASTAEIQPTVLSLLPEIFI
jgi:hypothetical protein